MISAFFHLSIHIFFNYIKWSSLSFGYLYLSFPSTVWVSRFLHLYFPSSFLTSAFFFSSRHSFPFRLLHHLWQISPDPYFLVFPFRPSTLSRVASRSFPLVPSPEVTAGHRGDTRGFVQCGNPGKTGWGGRGVAGLGITCSRWCWCPGYVVLVSGLHLGSGELGRYSQTHPSLVSTIT